MMPVRRVEKSIAAGLEGGATVRDGTVARSARVL